MKTTELLTELDEPVKHVSIEAKTASDVGKSLLETICAFSNEPDFTGGFILLSVAPAEDRFWPTYEVVGVDDHDKLQFDIASQCVTVFYADRGPRIEGAIHELQVSIDNLRECHQTLISAAVTGKITVPTEVAL